MKLSLFFHGPICDEVREGLTRIGAEVRRMVSRVLVRRRFKALHREWTNAAREVYWKRTDLAQSERNLLGLEEFYQQRWDELTRQLQALNGGHQ